MMSNDQVDVSVLHEQLINVTIRSTVAGEQSPKVVATLLRGLGPKVRPDGRVVFADGLSGEQAIERLRSDAAYGSVFGSSSAAEGESWRGKKYSEMTITEKTAYIEQKYGDG